VEVSFRAATFAHRSESKSKIRVNKSSRFAANNKVAPANQEVMK